MASAELDDVTQDDELSDGPGMDLFWRGVVKSDEPLVASPVNDFFLRITNASLGPDVQKNTRTCLQVAQQTDDDSEPPGVICTLKNNYENHALNLVISDDVQFTVAGENPSPIYLVGYWTPGEKYIGDAGNPFDMADDMEDMEDDDELTEEEMQDLNNKTKQKLLQLAGSRKRTLNEMEKDVAPELMAEDEQDLTSAQKKTKDYNRKS